MPTPICLARSGLSGEANKFAETPITDSRAASPTRVKTYVRKRVSRRRSLPCWAAAKATAAAVDSAVAAVMISTACRSEPVSAEITAPITAPARTPATIAVISRRPSSAGRETGVASSQEPSAAEASTGPNSRLAASAAATASANAAQGSMALADRHEPLVQAATTVCAWMMTLTTIAPIISPAITTM